MKAPAPFPDRKNSGFAMITALLLVAVLAVLLISYFATTAMELSSTKSTADMTTGFYAAEGGLNVRGERIRLRFDNYGIPQGVAPAGAQPCSSGNSGSGDFACETFELQGRNVTTYVQPGGENDQLNIPIGEPFAGLNALENTFNVFSQAAPAGQEDQPEALLQMIFRNRLVPLFQFAVFYDKDLEIMPGANMTLSGRVHVNGDLYLNTPHTLDIEGQVTAAVRLDGSAGNLYRYRKNDPGTACEGGSSVRVTDGAGMRAVGCVNPKQAALPQESLSAWNGQILVRQDRLVVPTIESFEVGGEYWQEADLRVGLDLKENDVNRRIKVYRSDGSLNNAATIALNDATCPAVSSAPFAGVGAHGNIGERAIEWSNSFRNNREQKVIDMLEVDISALFACLASEKSVLLGGGHPGVNTAEKGGFVLYLTVEGNDKDAINNYGVRLRNGATLPGVRGLTVVTDQALYVQGDYNLGDVGDPNWKPAAFIADSFNVLSKAFDAAGHDQGTYGSASDRQAVTTTVNGAVLSGTDTTFCPGNQDEAACLEGVAGPGGGNNVYNGGLENYPRLHESWGGSRTLRYRGSFVSLGRPRHVNGRWHRSPNYYGAPRRDWDYDVRFNDVSQLPPMTPRASYLVQERFSRDFRDQ